MTAYYNEFDPFARRWLQNLKNAGHLSAGMVDGSDINDVAGDELPWYDQAHWFAGVGGWPLALRLAGWPDDRPVWTASLPCQPFSNAGKRRGKDDERHLWPVFRNLVEKHRPPVIFGEQVASKDGREWLAGVRADLEALGYAVGAADLCAASAGAPHIRQRLFWVAYSTGERQHGRQDSARQGRGHRTEDGGADGGLEHAKGNGRIERRAEPGGRSVVGGRGEGDAGGGMGNPDIEGPQGWIGGRDSPGERSAGSPGLGPWSDYYLVPCADGKARRVGPGLFPLAHGVPSRVGRLRAYGNAIAPWLARDFILSCEEARA